MVPRALRVFRVLELVIPGFFVLFGLLVFAAPHPQMGFALGLWGFAAFAVLMFELRFWGHRRTTARVRRGLGEVGQRDLEGSSAVVERGSDDFIEEIAANRALASLLAGRSTRLCVTGRWQGRDLEIGTAVVAARDFDQKISYVCVHDRALRGPFRVMTRGAATSFSRIGMEKSPVATGDTAFDDKWVVDANDALCRAVLDPPLRAQLLRLQQQLSWMQVASVEATRFGLVLRWPGELSPEGAAYLRDLALAVHGRLAAAA
jgi:hypothetical protein